MKNIEQEQIKKVIWNAFPETNLPVGNILNTSNNQYEDYEGNCVKNFFSGKKNTDVTLKKLENEYGSDISACLFFMKPEAASYYLSSFMIISIESYYQADVLPHTVMNFISGELIRDKASKKWFDSVFIHMNKDQKNALVQFVNFMRHNYSDDMPYYDFDSVIESWGQ